MSTHDTMYQVVVATETNSGQWSGAVHSPTFYLDANVQGIRNTDDAVHIVGKWLHDMGLSIIDITVNEPGTYYVNEVKENNDA